MFVDDIWAGFALGNYGWSLYGTQLRQKGETKCIVIAAPKVATINLNHKVHTSSFMSFDDPFLHEIPTASELTIQQQVLGGCRYAYGDTYQEALATLFANWSPDVKEAEIARETPEIESGRD